MDVGTLNVECSHCEALKFPGGKLEVTNVLCYFQHSVICAVLIFLPLNSYPVLSINFLATE